MSPLPRPTLHPTEFDLVCRRLSPQSPTSSIKEMLGRESTPVELHSHTHKRQEDQQWVEERARKAHLLESQAVAGEGSSSSSIEYFEYCIWPQAIRGVHMTEFMV
ncbi:hypothetical protein KFK09_007257 [Dendrobium nobile]|uniref:Uncharacterized protein n=1 Tax=Dendrobium nobile TaxID=94219 RepID=A0A8T3BUN3_DENNO|nr:hypothetical protein KFK09_007257 [Dendrobium nobile]